VALVSFPESVRWNPGELGSRGKELRCLPGTLEGHGVGFILMETVWVVGNRCRPGTEGEVVGRYWGTSGSFAGDAAPSSGDAGTSGGAVGSG
jgi:hypothetical protein